MSWVRGKMGRSGVIRNAGAAPVVRAEPGSRSPEVRMIRSLLVPLDGSRFAEQAVPTAAAIARREGAALRLVRVHVPAAILPFAGAMPVDAEFERRLRSIDADYLDRAARRVEREYGVAAGRALLDGPVVDSIDRYAREAGADLIVMTTHGRGGIARAWLGSVADGLARRAHRPVLLIRPDRRPSGRLRRAAFRRVLVPLDGSRLAEQVIRHAVAVAGGAGARFLLFQVVPPLLAYGRWGAEYAAYAHHTERRAAAAAAYLDQVAARLARQDLPVGTRVVVHAQPAVAILEQIAAARIDLVAMATHGRGGVVRMMLGSVADKVLRGSPVPLLLLRPEAA